jgi:hypothetical protein
LLSIWVASMVVAPSRVWAQEPRVRIAVTAAAATLNGAADRTVDGNPGAVVLMARPRRERLG